MPSRRHFSYVNLFFHYFAIAYNLIVGILFVPLYLVHIETEIYSHWLAAFALIGLFSFTDPGLGGVIQQKLGAALGKEEDLRRNQLIVEALRLTILLALPLLSLCLLMYYNLSSFLGLAENSSALSELQLAVSYALGGTLLIFISHTLVGINQGNLNSLGTGLIFMISNTLSALWIFLRVRSNGVEVLGSAVLIRGFLMTTLNLILIVRSTHIYRLSGLLNRQIRRELLNDISFNFIGRLSNVGIAQVPIVILNRYVVPEHVISYKLSMTVFELIKMVVTRPLIAMQVAISNYYSEKQLDRVRDFLGNYTLAIVGILLLMMPVLLFSFEPVINWWVGSAYYISHSFVLLLIASTGLNVLNQSFLNLQFGIGKIKEVAQVNFYHGGALLLCLLVLVPLRGLSGVAYAFLISEIFQLFLLVVLLQRKFLKPRYMSSVWLRLSVVSSLICIFLVYNKINSSSSNPNNLLNGLGLSEILLFVVLTVFIVKNILVSLQRFYTEV